MKNIFLVLTLLVFVAIIESCTQSSAQANNSIHISYSDTSDIDKLKLDLKCKNNRIDTLIKKDSCQLRKIGRKINEKKWKMQ